MLFHDYYTESYDSIPMAIISEEDSEGGTPLIKKPYHLRGFGVDKFFDGPVDGVFSLSERKLGTDYDPLLRLWNPATRVITTLPPVPFKLQPFLENTDNYCGFGFDPPFTSNYKVVWVHQFSYYDGMFGRSYGAVYSSSTNSWRILKHKHHKILNSTHSINTTCNSSGYLNATYYWIDNSDCSLLSFDFGNEVFRKNRGLHVPRVCSTVLILRDGSINIMAEGFNSEFTLWLMIEPGVWNKLLTFQCSSLIEPLYHGLWDSTTVIFLDRSSWLFSYDIVTQETKHLRFQHQGELYFCSVHYYDESLVTIK
ncbi:hypothetical protein FXO38_25648 [Capsicum annuum]|nr:hypothetical protein FXO38_25648 [Capsicum annuum]